jgi:hypothetical protein
MGTSCRRTVSAIVGRIGNVMGTRAHDDALSTSLATASAAPKRVLEAVCGADSDGGCEHTDPPASQVPLLS